MPVGRANPGAGQLFEIPALGLLDMLSHVVEAVDLGIAFQDGQTALTMIQKEPPALIILDLMLPEVDGWVLTRRLRSRGIDTPILMLTARGEANDRILGLDMGADDYVAKPFNPRELVSRVRAILRRTQNDAGQTPSRAPIDLGWLILDPAGKLALVNNQPIELTAREFDLLYFLASHPGQVFSRDQLLQNIWGFDFVGDPSTVTVHICRLRDKIEQEPSTPQHLITVWGVGYRLDREVRIT